MLVSSTQNIKLLINSAWASNPQKHKRLLRSSPPERAVLQEIGEYIN